MRYLIIGNCAAGISAVEAIRKLDSRGQVTVVSDENRLAYCRCLISNYLAGTHTEKDLLLREEDFYQKNNIDLVLDKKAVELKPEERKVRLADGKMLPYDRLLIATGASPKPLGVPGEEKCGVFGFRTLEDAKNISQLSAKGGNALIFGGGLIGLKVGYALRQRGMEVEIIVKSPRILSRVVDDVAAQLIASWLQENGIKIRTGLGAQKIMGNGQLNKVVLDNNEQIDCNIIVVGKGVQPNTSLVEGKLDIHWGITTDQHLQTSIEDIYAAGDVAETTDMVTSQPAINALWTAATEQGRIAGLNMAGEEKEYPGSIAANSLEFFGLPIISIAQVNVQGSGYEQIVRFHPQRYLYKKLVLKGNRLVGAVLVGDIDNAGVYMALIRRQADISSVRDILIEDYFEYARVSHLLEQKEGFRESISVTGELVKTA